MTHAIARRSFPILFAAAMCLSSSAMAQSAKSSGTQRQFKVGPSVLIGRPKNVCVLEGKWADGEPFRYQAWDSCSKITIEWVAPVRRPQTVNQVYGRDRTFVIPAGRDGYKISNDSSGVWLFRNNDGEVEEILVRD